MDLSPVGYCGTPSSLRILVEKAEAAGLRLPIRKALVCGEAFPPSLRDWLRERGIEGFQAYATADAGLIAYETCAREGLVLDEGVLLEIVRPGTGDHSAVLPGACPSGRTNVRIRGWLGRADQTTKVKGMFVHPSQIAEVVRRHPPVLRARLVVSGCMADDRMTLRAETATTDDAALRAALAQTLRDVTKLRGEAESVPAGTLSHDGKVIARTPASTTKLPAQAGRLSGVRNRPHRPGGTRRAPSPRPPAGRRCCNATSRHIRGGRGAQCRPRNHRGDLWRIPPLPRPTAPSWPR